MSLSGRSRCAISPARNIAHSKPRDIDWKYGEPIAESPSRNTGELANGWSPAPAARYRRLVALRARYRFRGIRTISRSPSSSPLVSSLTESMDRFIDKVKLEEVAAQPLAVESRRHRLIVLG